MQIKTTFDFVRFCMDDDSVQFHPTEDLDWKQLYDFAVKQALVGIMYHGLEKMAAEQKPPKQLLMKWFMMTEQLKKNNQLLNEKAVEVADRFCKDGFKCCILKGQGNAVMYPNPAMRMPGDVDIWVSGSREEILNYVKQRHPEAHYHFFHAEYDEDSVSVEAHFMPGIMNNPLYNRRLQKYYSEQQATQCAHWVELPDGAGEIPVPTDDFNIVFQLCHMMHHFFDEGIGLRQMMDYYYLLKKSKDAINRKETEQLLEYLGLKKFAGAVMYVQQKIFGLEDEYTIAKTDERRGETLVYEILKGGNFGQHSGLTSHGTATKYLLKNWRSLQLVREYPAEALAEPLFRTYHFFWRKGMK